MRWDGGTQAQMPVPTGRRVRVGLRIRERWSGKNVKTDRLWPNRRCDESHSSDWAPQKTFEWLARWVPWSIRVTGLIRLIGLMGAIESIPVTGLVGAMRSIPVTGLMGAIESIRVTDTMGTMEGIRVTGLIGVKKRIRVTRVMGTVEHIRVTGTVMAFDWLNGGYQWKTF